MSITLTSNYQEMLSDADLVMVNSIVEEQEVPLEYVLECYDYFGTCYADNLAEIVETLESVGCNKDDMMDFIESYGVENLCYLEDYLNLVADYDADAVDAFIYLHSVSDLQHFEETYEGYYSTVSEFVNDYLVNYEVEVPSWIVIDCEATWQSALQYDFSEHNDYYFRSC